MKKLALKGVGRPQVKGSYAEKLRTAYAKKDETPLPSSMEEMYWEKVGEELLIKLFRDGSVKMGQVEVTLGAYKRKSFKRKGVVLPEVISAQVKIGTSNPLSYFLKKLPADYVSSLDKNWK